MLIQGAERKVRIQLPPAKSLQTFGPSRVVGITSRGRHTALFFTNDRAANHRFLSAGSIAVHGTSPTGLVYAGASTGGSEAIIEAGGLGIIKGTAGTQ
jgi:hypothetical protein